MQDILALNFCSVLAKVMNHKTNIGTQENRLNLAGHDMNLYSIGFSTLRFLHTMTIFNVCNF